jgi:hypothetical protein
MTALEIVFGQDRRQRSYGTMPKHSARTVAGNEDDACDVCHAVACRVCSSCRLRSIHMLSSE